MTPSEEIVAKFKIIERVSDEEDRVLGFRRLRLAERVKLDEWFPNLQERGVVFVSASLCEIDRNPIPFAKNRGELEAIMNRLEEHGVAAGTEAIAKIYGVVKPDTEDGEERESELDAAKK